MVQMNNSEYVELYEEFKRRLLGLIEQFEDENPSGLTPSHAIIGVLVDTLAASIAATHPYEKGFSAKLRDGIADVIEKAVGETFGLRD